MVRLTFDGNFCDIAQCRELPCPHGGNCTQRKVWEKLKAYEDLGFEPEEYKRTMSLDIIVRCRNRRKRCRRMSERQEHRQRLNARIAYAAAIERWAKNQPPRIRFFAVRRWLKEMPRKENSYAAD